MLIENNLVHLDDSEGEDDDDDVVIELKSFLKLIAQIEFTDETIERMTLLFDWLLRKSGYYPYASSIS
jgi:hypothetical protein